MTQHPCLGCQGQLPLIQIRQNAANFAVSISSVTTIPLIPHQHAAFQESKRFRRTNEHADPATVTVVDTTGAAGSIAFNWTAVNPQGTAPHV